MQAKDFINKLTDYGVKFFSGVPDSLLNALCLELINTDLCSVKIGVNEGNSLCLAAGHYMVTGDIPCVFMQNSGLGNIVNPFTSLSHQKVYGVPVLFIIGWRGEPTVKDEPQHVFMGEITLKLLDLLGINYKIIDENTTLTEIDDSLQGFDKHFKDKQSCAFVVRKGTFTGGAKTKTENNYEIIREKAIESIILKANSEDIVVSSTGKISRELFEVRERLGQSHQSDFLTVGSMGFASSVAAQIATQIATQTATQSPTETAAEKQGKRVICIDGDGAALMHMGSMAGIGAQKINNLVHIILDNELHESVGGVPTLSGSIDWASLAKACGYKDGRVINDYNQLDKLELNAGELTVIKVSSYSRRDLGRPTTCPKENLAQFMSFIQGEN